MYKDIFYIIEILC